MREQPSMTREYDRDIQAAREEGRREAERLVIAARRFVDAWWEFDGLPWQTHYNSVADHVVALDSALTEFGGSDAERGEG